MQPVPNPMKAIAWMAGALASFLVMAVSVRELSAGMHDLPAREMLALAPLIVLIFWIGWYPETFLGPVADASQAWLAC